MVLTHVLTLPTENKVSPFQIIASPFCQVVFEIGKTVTYLDQAMVIDMSVLSQINNIKGTHLFHSFVCPLDSFDLFYHCLVAIKAKPKSVSISTSRLVDCWVPGPCAYAYGPSTVEGTTHEPALIPESIGEDPSAVMVFKTRFTTRQPVIFDTGASLAITPDKAP